MKKILVSVFFVVVAAVLAYAIAGCQLKMESGDDAVDVYVDTTDEVKAEVDVATDTTSVADCGQFAGYWQCFCQSGLCSGQLWKTVVPCQQGSCAMVTDVNEVDGTTYEVGNCADIGMVKDGVLTTSIGGGTATVYWCVPAPPP